FSQLRPYYKFNVSHKHFTPSSKLSHGKFSTLYLVFEHTHQHPNFKHIQDQIDTHNIREKHSYKIYTYTQLEHSSKMQQYPRNVPGMYQMQGQQQQQPRKKKNTKGPKVTNQMIEDELDHLAACFESKRQQRLAKIPEEVAQCVKVERCCKPRPTCVDFFYDRFVRELTADDKMRRKIKTKSACRVSNDFKKFTPQRPPRPCPLPCVCKTVKCPCKPPLPPPSPQRTAASASLGQGRGGAPRPKSPWAGPRKTHSTGPNASANMNRPPQTQRYPSQAQGPMPRKVGSAGPYGAAGMGPRGSGGYQGTQGAKPYRYQGPKAGGYQGAKGYQGALGANKPYNPGSVGSGQWGSVPSKRVYNEETCMNHYPCK
ncbi:hypothetical protein WDU94_014052, partial [Cyamophila willieti]